MTLNIEELAHLCDFDLPTDNLGTLRSTGMTVADLSHVEESLRAGIPAVLIVRDLLPSTLHKLTGDAAVDKLADGPLLSSEELAAITESDLQQFALKQANILNFTSGDDGEEEALAPRPDESGADFLARSVERYRKRQLALREKLVGSFAAKNTIGKMMGILSENDRISGQLGSAIRGLALSPPPFEPIHIPTNPVHESNRRLEALVERLDKLTPVFVQCAEMIRSMNGTVVEMQTNFLANSVKADRQGRIATWFAVAGLVVSIAALGISTYFSWQSLLETQAAGKKSDDAADEMRKDIQRLTAEIRLEREAVRESIRATDSKQEAMRQPGPSQAPRRLER